MRTLLIATTNPGKLREIRARFKEAAVQLISLTECTEVAPPEETASTFDGNADDKALYYAKATGHWTLADDSGLEVDALNGAPGVHSARYAGPDADDQANNRKLVAALAGIPTERRTARFRCAMALANDLTIQARATGSIEGRIIDQPRGANGFGYDPHFLILEYGLTSAELTPELKNRISHRGRALTAMLPQLERLLAFEESRQIRPQRQD